MKRRRAPALLVFLEEHAISQHLQNDYQPVTRSRARGSADEHAISHDWPESKPRAADSGSTKADAASAAVAGTALARAEPDATTFLKRGHAFSFAALFAFTVVLYARPYDIYPSAVTASLALILGVITLMCFLPSQLALEGTLTTRPREVNLVLLFGLTGVLSIPLAISPYEAWHEFSDAFIRCIIIFIVLINVVRTETRLKAMMTLSIVVGIWLSVGAINDYRLGLMTVEGYRAGGRGGGIFGNSNDMALFLVTMAPLAVALLLQSRNLLFKAGFAFSALVMVAGIVLTYSRGGFLGLLLSMGFLIWTVGHRRRAEILIAGVVLVGAFLAVAPGGYGLRLASIFIPSLDPVGSSDARRGELFRSLYVAARHPVLGIGMGNYAPEMSYRGLVTHNSYTQVAAEMGLAALAFYVLFIVTPLRKLGQIVRETLGVRTNSNFYYLAVGLQASLLGYMICSFFASVAYLWYVYYLVGFAICLRRLYESETGKTVVVEKRRDRVKKAANESALGPATGAIAT